MFETFENKRKQSKTNENNRKHSKTIENFIENNRKQTKTNTKQELSDHKLVQQTHHHIFRTNTKIDRAKDTQLTPTLEIEAKY